MQFDRKVVLKVLLKSQAIEIKDLRIAFDIKKTRKREQNKAEIKIYNLNSTTRSKIKDEGVNIELYAGYVDDIGLIFKGDIREIEHTGDSENIVTTITGGDGDNALQKSTINETIKGGSSLKGYIESLVKKLEDIKVGKIVGLDGLEGNQTATTFTGTVRDELDRLALKYDFEYTIENHVVNVTRNNSHIGMSEIISAETGMIGSPVAKEDGVEVKVLLNNNLKCNALFRLESEFLKRDYRIDELTFNGDTHSTEYYSLIKGVKIA